MRKNNLFKKTSNKVPVGFSIVITYFGISGITTFSWEKKTRQIVKKIAGANKFKAVPVIVWSDFNFIAANDSSNENSAPAIPETNKAKTNMICWCSIRILFFII